MREFLDSFIPIIKKYPIEIFLVIAAVISTVISLYLSGLSQTETKVILKPDSIQASASKIAIDIQGGVVKPGVYDFNKPIRLTDLVNKAGGLSEDADKDFFSRNFNLARLVSDQEKIYIPLKGESAASPVITSNSDSSSQNSKLNINTATAKELEELPGIGPATAKKIVDSRPYSSIDDLISNKIIGQSIFENIKEGLSI